MHPRTIATRLLLLPALAVCAAILSPATAHAERRVALIIGNSAYTASPLANPARDADAIAAKLKDIGFESVALEKNLTYDGMRTALRSFAREASGAETAIIFYAGHGTEVQGRNFLIPVDAQLERISDLAFEAIALDTVLEQLGRVTRLRLIVLDACRNNIFPLMGRERGAKRGLARVEPESDTIVAFAAREGTTADDGSTGNSPFTTALLSHIATPGLDVRMLLGKVRDDVMRSTGGAQQPAIYGTLGGDAVALVPKALSPSGDELDGSDSSSEAARAWADVKGSANAAVLEAFIAQFPGTVYAALAREQLAKLSTVVAAVPAASFLVGTWVGSIEDKFDKFPYDIKLTFTSTRSGHVKYPSYPCDGELQRINDDAEPAASFKEKIVSGRDKCADGDVIVRQDGERLMWSWYDGYNDAPRATGALTKAADAAGTTERAAASTPAYVGTWASQSAQCKVPQEQQDAPLIMSAGRYDQHEAHCEFKRVSGNANEWKVTAECLVEGDKQPLDFGLSVTGDQLTIKDDSGERVLTKCN